MVLGIVGIRMPDFFVEYDPVMITMEDVDNILEYWDHFELKMPKKLNQLCQRFKSGEEITPRSQHELKVQLCRALMTEKHMYSEVMFKPVVQEAKKFLIRVRA